ncbi:MAG: hypothetical protein M5U19_12020 [Microthrixaceae bacterium]|nr:hypothetical protein [Microthrixaceae bacterium]
MPEQLAGSLEPHRPDALLLFEPDVVNHLELISEADLCREAGALEAHESQLESTHFYRLDAGSSREAALAGFRERVTVAVHRCPRGTRGLGRAVPPHRGSALNPRRGHHR